MESNDFDDIIKGKLQSISEAPDQRAWELFVLNTLNKGEDEIFDDKSTDELVKGALDNFKSNYNADSWDALLYKMEKPDDEDPILLQKRFDKEVSNSLKGVTRKYDVATWPRLAARLEAEEKYLRHYYRAKFVEACVFIFLILSLVQLSESGKLKVTSKLQDSISESTNTGNGFKQNTLAIAEKSNVNISNTDLNANVENKIIDISTILSTAGDNLKSNTKFIKDKIQAAISTPQKDDETGNPILNQNIIPTASLKFSNSTLLPVNQNLKPIYPQKDEQALDKIIALVNKANSKAIVLQPAPVLNNYIQELTTPNKSFALTAIKKSKLAGTWKIGAYTHFDYNEIYFPKQELEQRGNAVNTVQAKTVKSFGYGSGFKALYTKNRVGVEFGMGYSNKSYSPERAYYGNPELNAHFNNIEYDIIEIPIGLRYKSKANTRLRPYMQAGINGSFIVKEFYDVSVAIKPIAAPGSISHFEQSSFRSTIKNEFTKLDKTKVMAYAQGSLGLEWSLNDKIDISSQVNYSQRFLTKKFGLNFDQSKSLSLEVGIKTRL